MYVSVGPLFNHREDSMTHLLSKHLFITPRLPLVAAVLFGTMVAVSATSALAADAAEQQQLVDKAKRRSRPLSLTLAWGR